MKKVLVIHDGVEGLDAILASKIKGVKIYADGNISIARSILVAEGPDKLVFVYPKAHLENKDPEEEHQMTDFVLRLSGRIDKDQAVAIPFTSAEDLWKKAKKFFSRRPFNPME